MMHSRNAGAIPMWWTLLVSMFWAAAMFARPAAAATLRLSHVETALLRESVTLQGANAAGAPLRLSLSAGLYTQELILVPNRTVRGNATHRGTTAYEGEVPLRPGSWARLTRTPAGWVGIWFDGARHYALDRAAALAGSHALAAALPGDTPMVFALRDAVLEDASFAGDTLPLPPTAEALLSAPPMAAAVLPTRRLSVALIADAELAALDGEQTAANMLARLNIVDGIFASQLGVRISEGGTTILPAAEQPFSGTTPSDLLVQLRDYRSGSATQQAAGLSHLMTGRDLDERTVGIAYLESLCSSRFSASLSEARGSLNFGALIAAHEIGHVFGAPHDGEEGSQCSATPGNQFLMAPQLNASTSFSACSIEQIQPVLAAATCLAPIDAADAAIGAPLEARLALDQQTDIEVTVRSEGTVPVTDVVLAIDLPAGLAIDMAVLTGSSTSCTGTAPRFQCALGTLAPGTVRALQLGLRATAPGTGRAFLTLAAADDGLDDNNAASVRLIAEPGADLAVEVAAVPGALTVGSTTTATVTLRNLGLADAADARLTAAVPAGLALDSFTADRAVCTLAADSPRTVECPPIALAAGQVATLTLNLRGETAGAMVIEAVAQSSLPDPRPGNNRVGETITVSLPAQPAASGNSGGGGATDALALLTLGMLAGRRLRRRYESLSAK